MPEGMLNVLTKKEISDLVSYVEAGGFKLPKHLERKHGHQPSKPGDKSSGTGHENKQGNAHGKLNSKLHGNTKNQRPRKEHK